MKLFFVIFHSFERDAGFYRVVFKHLNQAEIEGELHDPEQNFDLQPQIKQPQVAPAPGVCPFSRLTTNGTDFSEAAIATTAAGVTSSYS